MATSARCVYCLHVSWRLSPTGRGWLDPRSDYNAFLGSIRTCRRHGAPTWRAFHDGCPDFDTDVDLLLLWLARGKGDSSDMNDVGSADVHEVTASTPATLREVCE